MYVTRPGLGALPSLTILAHPRPPPALQHPLHLFFSTKFCPKSPTLAAICKPPTTPRLHCQSPPADFSLAILQTQTDRTEAFSFINLDIADQPQIYKIKTNRHSHHDCRHLCRIPKKPKKKKKTRGRSASAQTSRPQWRRLPTTPLSTRTSSRVSTSSVMRTSTSSSTSRRRRTSTSLGTTTSSTLTLASTPTLLMCHPSRTPPRALPRRRERRRRRP
jgi:hypothetical protein